MSGRRSGPRTTSGSSKSRRCRTRSSCGSGRAFDGRDRLGALAPAAMAATAKACSLDTPPFRTVLDRLHAEVRGDRLRFLSLAPLLPARAARRQPEARLSVAMKLPMSDAAPRHRSRGVQCQARS